MKKKVITVLKIVGRVVISILAVAFVIAGTILVYYYASGYRFDLNDRNVRKTGVINIESRPSRADIYVNGFQNGKTTKTIPSINEGFAEIKLKKDGYREWSKLVPVLSEKSTPVFAELFKVKTERDTAIDISDEYTLVEVLTNKRKDIFIYLTEDSKGVYSIWRYDLNKSFWNLSNNPHLITTIESGNETAPTLLLSPTGNSVLATYTFKNTLSKEITESRIYNTQLTDSAGRVIDLAKFRSGYNLTWSNSESYMILESNTDILSVNITTQAKTLLYKKAEKEIVVWNTDTQSNHYYIQNSSDESGSYYSLEQINLDGTTKKTLIPRIYYKTDSKYIDSLRLTENIHTPFTNSPQNTRFVGEITGISIDQNTKGIFVSTTEASYWYVTLADKYITISPYKSEHVSYSPNRRSLIYLEKDTNKYGVFTFLKDENDPITKLGSKYIITEEIEILEVNWISNNNIAYTAKGDTFEGVFIIDKEGDNKYHILSQIPVKYGFANTGKYLHTIEGNNKGNEIVRYILQ